MGLINLICPILFGLSNKPDMYLLSCQLGPLQLSSETKQAVKGGSNITDLQPKAKVNKLKRKKEKL